MNDMTLARLARAVQKLGQDWPAFESLVLDLSPAQRRLFTHLAENGEADTITLRNGCSLGNVSETAIALNAKLEASGYDRRVVCEVRPHVNKYGERGQLGVWSLVEVQANAAA